MHVDDWLAVVRTVLSPPTEGPTLSGVVHATGLEPVRNADLMTALRRSLGRPAAPPTPARLVRLGAVLLRTDPALALTGRRALPTKLLDQGFCFRCPDLEGALTDLRSRQAGHS